MIRFIFIAALFIVPQFSHAAATSGEIVVDDHDKDKDIFYKFGGGIRLREYIMDNSTAGALVNTEDFLDTSHRAQLDLQLNKGEYFKTFFRAIHHSVWGAQATDQNEFVLAQAWGDWKVTDFLDLKFGREPVVIGRGLAYGANEWEDVPTFYDGFSLLFNWDVMELDLHALKLHELDHVPSQSVSDPETTHYIISLNFKELPDIIQMADLSFAQVISDYGYLPGTTSIIDKQRVQRFGFDLVASGVYFETGATVNYLAGTESTPTVDTKVKQMMLDGVAKFIMPDWSQMNLWLGAHYDTGDDDPTDQTNTQYEPLNYNLHDNAGRMDFFKFGNLTFLRSGLSFHLLSDWYFGGEYFMFQKSKQNAPNYVERGQLVSDLQNNVIRFGPDKSLGNEVDVWFGKTFPSGVNMDLTLSYLHPGKALNETTVVASGALDPLNKEILNLSFDLGFFF